MRTMNSRQSPKNAGFTLVELMAVIVIAGILAAVFAQALPFMQQKVRDKVRIHNFSNLRRILEVYRSDNGRYPSLTPVGVESAYAFAADPFASSWATLQTNAPYIPNVTPTYYPVLPPDPKPGESSVSGCQAMAWQRNILYVTDGEHYKLIYHCASETNDYSPDDTFYDPNRPDWAWAVSDDMTAASARGW